MTPMEAARRMQEHPPAFLDSVSGNFYCAYCGEAVHPSDGSGHANNCPWLVLPAIVAALEAKA